MKKGKSFIALEIDSKLVEGGLDRIRESYSFLNSIRLCLPAKSENFCSKGAGFHETNFFVSLKFFVESLNLFIYFFNVIEIRKSDLIKYVDTYD